uniref:Ig-like domain-containing protein n=1 Tax=Myripristis murdjan TaxID=586833 RepID=A0A667YSY4_9TELE
MSPVKCAVCVVVVALLWTGILAAEDVQVSCRLQDSCVLPCTFEPGEGETIYWTQQLSVDIDVHSFYNDRDQLDNQDQRYQGRTSLYKDQISGGNASLQLTAVTFQDQGRYKCYIDTILGPTESFIQLEVQVPVGKIDIQQVGNTTTCSSKGIYPQPVLTWSTDPPHNLTKQKPTIQQDQELFSISSSLVTSLNVNKTAFSCTVTAGKSRRTATLSQQATVSEVNTDVSIPCRGSTSDLTGFRLTWSFNHRETILMHNFTETPSKVQIQEPWRQLVQNMSESGSLELQASSLQREGIYTCELSDAKQTHISNTFLKFETKQVTGEPGYLVPVIITVIVLALASLVIFIIMTKCKGKPSGGAGESTRGVGVPLSHVGNGNRRDQRLSTEENSPY